jgi:II/X family phage/plasmid replication protein
MTYELWSLGRDVRQFMGKTKFYKDRKVLLEMGIDISVPKPVNDENINVVPLKRVLELKPAGIPDWAYGTNLVFEPRKLCN